MRKMCSEVFACKLQNKDLLELKYNLCWRMVIDRKNHEKAILMIRRRMGYVTNYYWKVL